MKERIFIQRAKENVLMQEFVRSKFKQAKCGRIEVQHTPIVTRIIIHTTTPGMVIGSGGERIKEAIEILKTQFNVENPQIDVQRVENPDVDSFIIAQSLASSIESGINYKKLGNYYVERIMSAGAVGCEILFAGKLSGERSRRVRFTKGYLKKCGFPAQNDVLYGFALANPKLGNIGVTVKIMLKPPESLKTIAAEKAKEMAAAAEAKSAEAQETIETKEETKSESV